tara:strand:+ start:66 stop:1055 length:990 start_codon:yes stop_codon:yes gene_type:complete
VEATTEMSMDNAVEALLAQEPETAEVETTDTETEEVEEAEVEDTEVEDSDDDDADDADDDDEDEYEGDEGEADSDEQDDSVGSETYTVKVDGVDVEATLQDLIKSYSGQRYINQGMQKASELKKQAEQAYNGLIQQRAQLDQYSQQVSQNGLVSKPIAPTRALFTDDPLGYMDANLKYSEDMELYQADQNQLAHNHKAMQEAQAETYQANLQYQQEELKRLIPDFADAKKATKLKDNLIRHGGTLGFTEVELRSVVDARTMRTLHESMLWRQSLEGKSDVQAKLKKARPLMKSGVKKTGESVKSVEKKLMSKLKKSGSINDAAALLFNS